MKIGIQNFRIFKEYQEFDLRPLTLLVGPNNAGKSALSKLFLLLQEGVHKLNFEKGRHNISNFENAVTKGSEKDYFTVTFEIPIEYFDENVKVQINYIGSFPSVLNVFSDNELILHLRLCETVMDFSSMTVQEKINKDKNSPEFNFYLNHRFILNKFFEKKIRLPYDYDFEKNSLLYQDFNEYLQGFAIPAGINFSNYRGGYSEGWNENLDEMYLTIDTHYRKKIDEFNTNGPLEISSLDNLARLWSISDFFSTAALSNEIDKIQNNSNPFRLFEIFENGENVTDQYEKYIAESFTSDRGSLDNKYNQVFSNNFDDYLRIATEGYVDRAISRLKDTFDNEDINKKFEFRKTESYNLLFNETFVNRSTNFSGELPPVTFISQFYDIYKNIVDILEKFRITTVFRGLQLSQSDNEGAVIVSNFALLPKETRGGFVNFALEKLNIKERFHFDVNILNSGKKVADLFLKDKSDIYSINDMGFGLSMLLPILMQIEIMGETGGTLFIEEPETNLHPNFQSQLADIFIESNKRFPLLKIVLETHSEYLIRKLQLLTAQNEISADKSIIYYFNADSNVNPENPKIVEIEIKPHGGLTEDFGPGFYDEAVRLQFNLSNINREQLN